MIKWAIGILAVATIASIIVGYLTRNDDDDWPHSDLDIKEF